MKLSTLTRNPVVKPFISLFRSSYDVYFGHSKLATAQVDLVACGLLAIGTILATYTLLPLYLLVLVLTVAVIAAIIYSVFDDRAGPAHVHSKSSMTALVLRTVAARSEIKGLVAYVEITDASGKCSAPVFAWKGRVVSLIEMQRAIERVGVWDIYLATLLHHSARGLIYIHGAATFLRVDGSDATIGEALSGPLVAMVVGLLCMTCAATTLTQRSEKSRQQAVCEYLQSLS